jgi:hypothetical protein
MINRGVVRGQIELGTAEGGREAVDKPKSAGNSTDSSSQGKKRLRRILNGGFSGHQNFLIGQVRRRRPIRDKR